MTATVTAGTAYFQRWTLIAAMPPGQEWHTGVFPARRFASETYGGVDFFGDGRGCNATFGVLDVRNVRFHLDGSVADFDAFFEQHCEQPTAPALFGHAVYTDLRSYTFKSDATNPLTLGQSSGYHAPDSTVGVTYDGRNMHAVVVGSNNTWTIDMTPPRLDDFAAGTSYATQGGARNDVGALNVTRNGKSCSRPNGHLNIADVAFSGSTVTRLLATFDIVCQGSTGVLTGELEIRG
jgi:hypothetical protein